MYIENKYWNNYIGGTDDSLTLVEYLAWKGREEISLTEMFSDIGLDKLEGDFHRSEEPLTADLKAVEPDGEEFYGEFYYAIDLIMDLAALLLECRVSGRVDLRELAGEEPETDRETVCITASQEEYGVINRALIDFVSDPLAYDLSEMCPEEDMLETAAVCENLRKELEEYYK